MRIVLASASPRRRSLLAALGLSFDVVVSNADETFEGAPAEMVEHNACVKRDEVAARLTLSALTHGQDVHATLVIAADTLVFLDRSVLGKPADAAEARAMLARLSGRTHQVLTGLAVANTGTGATAQGHETTDVTFRALTATEIHRFVEAVNPIDRAGAYTVDGPGSLLVAAYRGCYQNVLGLPIVRLDTLLRSIGPSLFDLMDADRCTFL